MKASRGQMSIEDRFLDIKRKLGLLQAVFAGVADHANESSGPDSDACLMADGTEAVLVQVRKEVVELEAAVYAAEKAVR